LYCPSCDETFDSNFSRCPECHGWLKTRTLASVASAPKDWGAVPQAEEGDGWNYDDHVADLNTRKSQGLEGPYSDDWVDEELEEIEDEIASHPTIQYAQPKKNGFRGLIQVLALAVGALVTFVLISNFKGEQPVGGQQPDNSTSVAVGDAAIWLNSAKESQIKEDYSLAAVQLEKGLEFLKEGNASPDLIQATEMDLALAHEKAGELDEAYLVWQRLKPSVELASEKMGALEKKQRVRANGLLDEGEKQLNGGDPGLAEINGKKALRLYKKYNGQSGQLARSHDLIGRAYGKKGNALAAVDSLRRAQKRQYSETRQSLIEKWTPASVNRGPVRSSQPRTQQPTQVKFVEPDTIPKAPPPVVKYRSEQLEPQSRPTRAASQPPEEKIEPNYDPALTKPYQRQEDERLGDDGVLPTYSTGSSKSKPPGY